MPWPGRALFNHSLEEDSMPDNIKQDASDDSLEHELAQDLERERREHALIDEEKLGMDELEEERLKHERLPPAPTSRP